MYRNRMKHQVSTVSGIHVWESWWKPSTTSDIKVVNGEELLKVENKWGKYKGKRK